MITSSGKLITNKSRLPVDGAMLNISVPTPPIKSGFSATSPEEPPFKPEINDALQMIMRYKETKGDMLRSIIDEVIDERYQLFPSECKEDLCGARLCSNSGK